MAMLSIPDSSLFYLDKFNVTPALLSHAFRSIRVLRLSIENPEYEMAVWRFLTPLLSTSMAGGGLSLPYLQELWFGPYSCRRSELPPAIKRLVKRVRDRSLHPANRIHTIRLDIARPEAHSTAGAEAVALQSLFSNVLWSDK